MDMQFNNLIMVLVCCEFCYDSFMYFRVFYFCVDIFKIKGRKVNVFFNCFMFVQSFVYNICNNVIFFFLNLKKLVVV